MNAHSYKEWADESNSVLINPCGKIPAYDGMFFHKGQPFNQGNIFDFNEDEFIFACEKAVARYESNPVNVNGEKLIEKFNSESFLDSIVSYAS